MNDLETLQNASKKAAKIVAAYRRGVSQTNGKTLIGAGERQKHIEKLRSEAQRKLRALDDDVAAAHRRLVAGSKTTVVGSASEQQLSEVLKSKAWDRLRGMLEVSLKPGSEVDTLQLIQDTVRDAVGKKDKDHMQMLQEELRPWLLSKDMDYYIDILPTLLKPGNELLGTSAPTTVIEDVTPGYKRVSQALRMAEHVIANTDPTMPGHVAITAPYDLPDYEVGETVEIPAVTEKTFDRDAQGRIRQTQDLPELVEAD